MKSLLPILGALVASAAAQWQQGGAWHDGWHPHKPRQHVHGMGHIPGGDHQPVPSMGNSTFTQLIDHEDPSAGTFQQWYMYDTTHYKGPGSPIVLFTPGEVNASAYTSYLTTNRTTGVVAQEIGAAVIVIEHRYWGTSTPVTDLTTANMKHLTLDNAIKDFVRFAQEVRLPFARAPSNAKEVPWVIMGGSYSGALSAWIESVSPGTFWAYHASSAPVQAISNYWGYFLPVQEGMPKNCSKDVNLVIDHLDKVLMTGTAEEIHEVKAMFGLENVEHHSDFMGALQWGAWLWQGNQFYLNSGFFTWCDFIENAVNETDPAKIPGEEGVGLEKALAGYAKWGKDFYFPGFCQAEYGYFGGGLNTECFSTFNASSPIFTDTSLSNTVDRQWVWMTCNEPFGYWQDGAPSDRPTLVSRLIDADYWIRQCSLYFPPGPNGETFGIAKGKSERDVNAFTGGWDIDKSTRLIYANGGFDPWREVSVSSELRPSGPLQSTAAVPINIIPGGFHTSDLITENGVVNAGAKAVIDAEVKQLVEWVREFPSRPWEWGSGHGQHWQA